MNKQSSLYRKRPKDGRRRRKRFRNGKIRKAYERIKGPFQISIFNYCFSKRIDTLKFERPLFIGGNHQFAEQIFNISDSDRDLMKLLHKDGKPWEEIIRAINDLNKLRDSKPSDEVKAQMLKLMKQLIRPELFAEGQEAIMRWSECPDS